MRTREEIIEAAAVVMAYRALSRPLETVASPDVLVDALLWTLEVPDAARAIDFARRFVSVSPPGRGMLESFKLAIDQMAKKD